MAQPDQNPHRVINAATLEKALELACERIADSYQEYEEANTPDGWYEEFIRRAEANEEPAKARM